jgi:hypothetical protein
LGKIFSIFAKKNNDNLGWGIIGEGFSVLKKNMATCKILSRVASKMIGSSQTTFVLGRYILDGVIILHETIRKNA